jgi:hypothetical protein
MVSLFKCNNITNNDNSRLRESKMKESNDRIKKKNNDYTDDDDYEEEVEEIENNQRNIKSKISRKDVLEKPSTGHKSRRHARKE